MSKWQWLREQSGSTLVKPLYAAVGGKSNAFSKSNLKSRRINDTMKITLETNSINENHFHNQHDRKSSLQKPTLKRDLKLSRKLHTKNFHRKQKKAQRSKKCPEERAQKIFTRIIIIFEYLQEQKEGLIELCSKSYFWNFWKLPYLLPNFYRIEIGFKNLFNLRTFVENVIFILF